MLGSVMTVADGPKTRGADGQWLGETEVVDEEG
jgi:hypothetical protein